MNIGDYGTCVVVAHYPEVWTIDYDKFNLEVLGTIL